MDLPEITQCIHPALPTLDRILPDFTSRVNKRTDWTLVVTGEYGKNSGGVGCLQEFWTTSGFS